MSLAAGSRLGPYEIVSPLGAGGMGEVYRARDTNLNREVALKVLPAELAAQSDRLTRLRTEARALAASSHPNIAAVHSFEEVGGVRFLVMELVEGQTLARLIRRGGLGIRAALEICRQIAEGLQAAHEKGIVHRDLKPSNVMVTQAGEVKIVDFGLAKTLPLSEAATVPGDVHTPSAPTASGTILGTAPYMSPEQVRGENVDVRTDIWAFGCVMYETLTGKRAFGAKTFADTVARILESEPDWHALPPSTPPVIQLLQRRCLAKSPRHRFQDIGDARVIIEETLSGTSGFSGRRAGEVLVRMPRRLRAPAWLAALLAVGLVGAVLWGWHRTPSSLSPMRTLEVALPAGHQLVSPPAFSPDGLQLVYAAAPVAPGLDVNLAPSGEVGDARLYVRSMVTGRTAQLAHSEGASYPLFSPDGDWVGFFAQRQLKKVPLNGGEPLVLCEVRVASRAAWGPDNRICFAPSSSKTLAWVSALGGTPEALPAPEGAPVGLDSPEVLPGGEALLLRVFAGRESPIGILSLKTGRLVTLRERGIDPRYVPSGHIVYIRGGGLMAVPFDLARLRVTGPETQVVPNAIQYAVSPDGTLAYAQGDPAEQKTLVWVDREGRESPLGLPDARYGSFQISPDGTRLAAEVEGATVDIFVFDLKSGAQTRLTQEGNDGGPAWTPDGERVTFFSDRANPSALALYSRRADGSGEAERIPSTTIPAWHSWSPDGRYLAITDVSAGQPDIWILPIGGGSAPYPLLNSSSSEWGAAFSPDGRWIAYASDESGRFEIYVRPAPGREGTRRQVSSGGGEEPRWSRKGDEIFFRDGQRWMAAPVAAGPTLTFGTPQMLFEGDYLKVSGIPYDVSPDGRRLLVLKSSRGRAAVPFLRVVLNWQQELERRARPGVAGEPKAPSM